MAQTVSGAFNTFRQNKVDLDPEQTRKARASRDYLFSLITTLGRNDPGFPRILSTYRPYGSFARNSKVRPLDDIDFLVLLNNDGTALARSLYDRYVYRLQIINRNCPLALFADDSSHVNSIKVLNKIKSSLAMVPNYKQAELKRNNQAVTLNLQTHPWVFDIVAAAPIDNGLGRTVYYLIPDGSGNWIATDPRVDAENVIRTNTWHQGLFLPTLRLLKYWNNRTHKPRLGSYYFENLALKVFNYATRISDFSSAVGYFFSNCPNLLFTAFPDPKKLGPDLNASLDWATKLKVSEAMTEAQAHIRNALTYEARLQHREAIGYWKRVFGPEFPDYG